MRTAVATLLAAALLALFPGIAAACGAGGGGGSPTPGGPYGDFRVIEPVWTGSSAAAKASAAAGGHLVALEATRAPIGVWDDALAERSRTMPFVRLQDGEARDFAGRWGMTVPGVAVCDAHGNVLEAVEGQLTARKIAALIERLPQSRSLTAAGLARQVEKARAHDTAGRTAQALQVLADVARFTGYEACVEGAALAAAIGRRADEALEAGLAAPTGERRSALVALRRAYPGTSAAERAAESLASLR